MRITRNIVIAGATTVLLGATVLAGAPAQAASTCPTVNGVTPDTCVTSVTVSRSTAALSGAASVPLTVSIGLHSGQGVPSGPLGSYGIGQQPDVAPELYFSVRRGQTSVTPDRLGLALTSGDVHDGVWQGTLNITALDAGTLMTSFLFFGGLGHPALSRVTIPVELRRSVAVSASRVPLFEFATGMFTPYEVSAGAPFAIKGRVLDARTRGGLPRITVTVQELDAACACFLGRYTATTDSAGYWHVNVPHLTSIHYGLSVEGPVNSDGRRANIAFADGTPYVLGAVAARLSATTAHRGDPVLVTGTAKPAGGQTLILEKWVSRAWKGVATAPVRASGRFTLPANPSAAGHWEYRVRDYQAHAISAPMFLDVS